AVRVIVHISQPTVVNDIVQIDAKPSNTREPPPITPVNSLLSEKAVDKIGDSRFHSKYPRSPIITVEPRNKLTETVLTSRNRSLQSSSSVSVQTPVALEHSDPGFFEVRRFSLHK